MYSEEKQIKKEREKGREIEGEKDREVINANKAFDTETKLRLIITLINDEGKDKLQNNIEKLINRVIEHKADYTNEIQRIFTNT